MKIEFPQFLNRTFVEFPQFSKSGFIEFPRFTLGITDNGRQRFCVILVRKWGEMLFCAILCSIFAVACV